LIEHFDHTNFVILGIVMVKFGLTILTIEPLFGQMVKKSWSSDPPPPLISIQDIRGAEIAGLSYNNFPSDEDTCQVLGLDQILVPRVPGTPGNRAVRDVSLVNSFVTNSEFCVM
jgi:hypothetical protein